MSEQREEPIEFIGAKIIATVGPATGSYEAVRSLIAAGANVIRLNFSHGTHEQHADYIKMVRAASRELGMPVAIIQDLQGPKIRLGDLEDDMSVTAGQTLELGYGAGDADNRRIPIQYDLSAKVKPGERLLIWDGRVRTMVQSISDEGVIRVVVENDGVLKSRKGLNLPDTDFGGDVVTSKDEADLAFGASTGEIDYVAQSFVQQAADAVKLRELMQGHGMDALLIAKVETAAALEDLEGIVKAYDAVMVARGDLAVETPYAKVPLIQRELIRLGHQYAKPVIVATQMLLHMTAAPDPTRAEVADIAFAVMSGADALMLSEETAAGDYPIRAVESMREVIRATEEGAPFRRGNADWAAKGSRRQAIAAGITSMAQSVGAKLIIAETKTGATARQISAMHAATPLVAVTNEQRTAQQLCMVHGVASFVRPVKQGAGTAFAGELKQRAIIAQDDVVVTASGRKPGVAGTTDTIKIVY